MDAAVSAEREKTKAAESKWVHGRAGEEGGRAGAQGCLGYKGVGWGVVGVMRSKAVRRRGG